MLKLDKNWLGYKNKGELDKNEPLESKTLFKNLLIDKDWSVFW